ncbi:nitrite reductase small subunit NirD [Allostreptomyces psammosilenae]|uniref:Nitrite reductase (NADH) small subunit n=1 Tax=Allostreptomyces psammosilenae TaxID=1892865 RepID=A0A853A4C5_9ACTN|nr:nitrite reductase small subunit NirD [Allostreptomyces psammosilenae]NYI05348.1 nitrite reductase (NADH) small subunit [Allostreptomyces psammosilenae]
MTITSPETTHGTDDATGWITVCSLADLAPEQGRAALLPDGAQVAIFRLQDDALYALGNIDPFWGAPVMAHGIVGDRAGVPTVATPLLKQVFSLETGQCLDDPAVSLPVYPIEVVEGAVRIAVQPSSRAVPSA